LALALVGALALTALLLLVQPSSQQLFLEDSFQLLFMEDSSQPQTVKLLLG
jgi:hypothetical protein